MVLNCFVAALADKKVVGKFAKGTLFYANKPSFNKFFYQGEGPVGVRLGWKSLKREKIVFFFLPKAPIVSQSFDGKLRRW